MKYESYRSVATCREVLEYYDTLYIGEYQFVSFEYIYCDE